MMEISNLRLGIGLPLTDTKVHSQFLDSWVLMKKPAFVYLRPQFPGQIDAIRNNIVEQAKESKCTHLLMMDTDQTYPPNIITKLLSHNLSIVAGKVHRRYPPFDPILYREMNDGYERIPDSEWKGKELIEVDATGAACLLCKIEVFNTIEYPWFKQIEKETDGKQKIIGEDVNFCIKAKKAGYKIFVDISVKIGHLGLLEVNETTYDIFKLLEKNKH